MFPTIYGIVAGAGGPLLLDTFTDTNGVSLAAHTPDSNPGGNAWVQAVGATNIQSNRARCVSGDRNVINVGHADITLSVVVNTSTAANALVIFRYVNTSSYWFLQIREGFDDIRLIRFTGANNVEDSAAVVINGGTNYTVVVTASGNNISATLDGGANVGTSNNYNNTATLHGIGSAGANTDFDNLTIWRN